LTINDWLLSYTRLRSGPPIGPRLSNPLSDQTQTHFDEDDSSAEFEFDWDPGDDTQLGLQMNGTNKKAKKQKKQTNKLIQLWGMHVNGIQNISVSGGDIFQKHCRGNVSIH